MEAQEQLMQSTLSFEDKKKKAIKLKRAHLFIAKWKNESLCRFMENWKKYTRARHKYKRLVERSLRNIICSTQSRILRSWVAYSTSRRRKRVAIERFRARWINIQASKAFNSWTSFVVQRRTVRRLTKRWLCNRENSKVSSGWNKWVEFAHASKQEEALKQKQRTIVTSFVSRLKNKGLLMSLNRWREHVKLRKRLRGFVKKMLFSQETKKKNYGFKNWLRNTTELCENEMGGKIDVLEATLNALREENEALKKTVSQQLAQISLGDANLSEAQKKHKELKLSSAHNLIATWKNKSLHRVLSAWKTYAKNEARGKSITRRFVARWENKQIYSYFKMWMDMTLEAMRHDALVHKYATR